MFFVLAKLSYPSILNESVSSYPISYQPRRLDQTLGTEAFRLEAGCSSDFVVFEATTPTFRTGWQHLQSI
jgi:hypothetical protein